MVGYRVGSLIGTVLALIAALAVVVPQTALAQPLPGEAGEPRISISAVDTSGFMGKGISMVLDDNGFPVIAYYSELIDLRIVRCNDQRCAGGDESIVAVPGGEQTSVVLDASGFPVIASTAGLVRCTSPTCADGAWQFTPKQRIGLQTNRGLALDANDNPILAHITADGINIERCNDPFCVGDDESISTPHAPNAGWNAVMELDAAGNPVVVYQDRRNGDLQLLHCGDPGCTDGNESIERVGESPYFPQLVPGLAIDDDGNPVVFYVYETGGFLVRCDDPDCAPGGDVTTEMTVAHSWIGTYRPTLRLDTADRPVLAYRSIGSLADGFPPLLRVATCPDRFCTGTVPTPTIVDDAVAIYSAMELDSADRPVIAYQETDPRDVLVAQCGDPACTAGAGPTDQLEVMHATSCLAGNGRVDTNIVNRGTSAATYRVEFEGLTARENTLAAKDWWRMPVTGRPDGSYDITVKRDGVVVSEQTVTITCDAAVPAIDDPDVRIISACRNGLGYVLFQFVNPGADTRPFVITFEGVPNRSTSAPGYGQSVRAVTGRPNGTYPATIRSGDLLVGTYDIVVDC